MFKWLVLALVLFVVGCATCPKPEAPMPSSDDAEAIYREIQAFSDSWSKGDAKGAASFYAEDGVRVGAAGDVEHGRQEIEGAYDRLLHGPFSGATVTTREHASHLFPPPRLAANNHSSPNARLPPPFPSEA
jgi:hypothetical protein